jgi:uncharacterized repeat protein (TIGR01451 family)
MNIKEDTKLITLAFVMIALIFAVIAPSTTAEVPLGNPAGFSANKGTVPSDAVYEIGDPIEYTIRLRNPGDFNATVDIWDVLPNGTIHICEEDAYYPADSEVRWCNFSTVVAADWDPDHTGRFINKVRVVGHDDNPAFWPDGDAINVTITRTSLLAPPEFDFDWEPACCYNISFSGEADKDVVNYTWDFGDGVTEVHEENLPGETFHVYDACGEYTVTLSGWSEDGQFSGTEKDIYVDCGPKNVIATADPECYENDGTEITFSATATPDTLPIVHYEWRFSDDPDTVYVGQIVERMVDQDITATVTAYSGLEDVLCCPDTDTVPVGPCSTEVPVLLPIGLIALVGLLTVIATSTILRKKK